MLGPAPSPVAFPGARYDGVVDEFDGNIEFEEDIATAE